MSGKYQATISGQMASFAAALRYDQLPADVRKLAQLVLLVRDDARIKRRSLSDLQSDKLLKQNGLQDPEESTDPMATKVPQTRVGACNGAFLRKFTSNFQTVLPLAACSKCYVRQAARAVVNPGYIQNRRAVLLLAACRMLSPTGC